MDITGAKFAKRSAAIAVLSITAVLFGYYIRNHPELWWSLQNTHPKVLIELACIYLLIFVALSFVTYSTLALCGINMGKGESILLTMYTAIVNFFGPLQSGPAFRGLYMRKKHNLSIKKYAGATLLFYALFGGISVVMLLSSLIGWWLFPLILIGSFGLYIIRKNSIVTNRIIGLDMSKLSLLLAATGLQLILVTFAYFIELQSVLPHVTFGQAITYSGAANLALFVSLTPGAIGFRESFLYFSQNLHHVPTNAIVVANVLDRSIYVALLLLIAVWLFGTHSQRALVAATKKT